MSDAEMHSISGPVDELDADGERADASIGADPPPEKAANADAIVKGKTISLTENIRLLKEEAKRLKDGKKKVAKDLKNAVKRRRRLQQRARQLSQDDLIEVLRMRSDVPAEPAQVPPDAIAQPAIV
jgi:FtsZ-binding cell division protein ZapB